MNKTVHIFVFFLFATLGLAAQPSLELLENQVKYPGVQAVTLNQSELVTISHQGDGLVIRSKVYEENMLLSRNIHFIATQSVGFSALRKIEKIDAYTLVPSGKKYKRVDASVGSDYAVMSEAFYDDFRARKITFPAMEIGCKTVLSYEKLVEDPYMWGVHYLCASIPIQNGELTVVCPSDVKLRYVFVNIDSTAVSFTKSVQGKNTTYSWKYSTNRGYSEEEFGPESSWFMPHMLIHVDSYEAAGKDSIVLGTQQSLYRWYTSLLAQSKNEPSTEMYSLVDSLKKSNPDRNQLIQSIYSWVQRNIRYVAFEDGYGGFIPRSCQSVFQNRYGDCKDMANLLKILYDLAGIEAYRVWIGTWSLPYKQSEVFSPWADNHMVVAVRRDNGSLWVLDATASENPANLPGIAIQGKEGLVGINDTSFTYVEVPIVDAFQNREVDTIEVFLDGNTLVGNCLSETHGYLGLRMKRRTVSTESSDLRATIAGLFSMGSSKYNVKKILYILDKDAYAPFKTEFEFEIPDAAMQTGSKLYINPHLIHPASAYKIDTARRYTGYDRAWKTQENYVIYFEIPKGYSVNYCPIDCAAGNNKYHYSIKYERTDDLLTIRMDFLIDFLYLPVEELPAWNNFVKEMERSLGNSLILEKTI